MQKKNCMIVAEVGQAHDGSLGNTMAFIDAVASVGVDAVKFQCHLGDTNSSVRAGVWLPQDGDRVAYWERTRFMRGAWTVLRSRAEARGLQFGVSCFSSTAYYQMRAVGPDFWKIPSGHWLRPYHAAAFTDSRPVIVSANFAGEIVEVNQVPDDTTWVHCANGDYPCLEPGGDRVGESVTVKSTPRLAWLMGKFSAKNELSEVTCEGLSCHCPSIAPGIEAAKRGAKYIEYHVCWDRRQFGPDTTSSLTVDEFAELVKGVRACEK